VEQFFANIEVPVFMIKKPVHAGARIESDIYWRSDEEDVTGGETAMT